MNKLIVFTLDNQRYGISSVNIDRIIRTVEISPLSNLPLHFLGMINIHGKTIFSSTLKKCMKDQIMNDITIDSNANTMKSQLQNWFE